MASPVASRQTLRMMKASTRLAVVLSLCSFASPVELEASSAAEKPRQILCSYLLYGSRQFVCGPPPLEDLQKKCAEKATAERGEETTCQCSDDPNYIRDTCD